MVVVEGNFEESRTGAGAIYDRFSPSAFIVSNIPPISYHTRLPRQWRRKMT